MSSPELSMAITKSSPAIGHSPDSTALNYAFLVHSQKTLTQNLPPRVDNKLLARQKRRRTSPEDHAILEAEYQKNPKPDKAVRASIVSRVALGEKEVQIWFQNRRQNDRRKSKPLEPHEFVGPRAPALDSSQGSSSEDSVTAATELPNSSDPVLVSEKSIDGPERDVLASLDASFQSRSDRDALIDEDEIAAHNEEQSQNNALLSLSQTEKAVANDGQGANKITENQGLGIMDARMSGRKRAYSTNNDEQLLQLNPRNPRRSTLAPGNSPPSLRISMSFDGEALVRKETEATPSPPKTRSGIRISLSSDGEALIRALDEPSPSKNRLRLIPGRAPRVPGLRRSSSAVNVLGPRVDMGESESAKKAFGRSRDARTWELYCDTDARSALSPSINSSKPLHGETSRSHRSQSFRSLSRSSSMAKMSVLGTKPNLVNRIASVEQAGEKRRKLSRTLSSLGRLETNQKNAYLPQSSLKKSSTKEFTDDIDLQPGDSDKENWLPGTQVSGVRLRRTGLSSQRSVLSENARPRPDGEVRARGSDESQGAKRGRGKASNANFPINVDEEVMAFMSTSDGSSQNEDLDCIQGLLSLSQGAWR